MNKEHYINLIMDVIDDNIGNNLCPRPEDYDRCKEQIGEIIDQIVEIWG